MAGKTKPNKTSSLQKSSRQKEKKQKWVSFIGEELEEYYNSQYDKYYNFDYDFNYDLYKINFAHSWQLCEKESRESYDPVFVCKVCGIYAIGKPTDRYSPHVYAYYTTNYDESTMSCAEICVKDIIE